MVQVLAVNIRNHGDGGQKVEERAVTFIGLDHHQFTLAQPGAGGENVQASANDSRGIKAGLRQHHRDH